MKPLGLSYLAWLGWFAIAGCSRAGQPRSAAPTRPPAETPGAFRCADAGSDASNPACPTPPLVLTTQPLQESLHDLRRLGLVTAISEAGRGRLALTLGREALAPNTPLAYHLEHFYKAFRSAYDLGDGAMFELWYEGRQVGSYTSEGLLLRR